MTFDFGDVLIVEFPFTDGSTSKRRPAVVISSAEYNQQRPDLALMAITSQMRPVEAELEVYLAGWQDAGLAKPSALKPVVFSLAHDFVRSKAGVLAVPDLKELRGLLGRSLG